ncbi:hypothetical protein FB451DRAFT_1486619 [Mycena latifolia]|nr:hypothetical protein FB451DRAFT_1486619 [Mycena latifolia]
MKTQMSPVFSGLVRRARALTITGTTRPRRGSNADSSAYDIMPPELWLKVFLHIPLYLLPSVTLTCRSFRAIAQPLLFTTISTHPKVSPAVSTVKSRKRVADRLQFFCSPQIHLTVWECQISPPEPEEDDPPAEDLVDAIFDALPTFPNLRTLKCRYVRLTPKRLAILQELRLTTISLELCFGDISDLSVASSVPLQHVTFKYPYSFLGRDKADPCLLFLSSTHLKQLHATTTSITTTLARSQPFVSLRTLEIPTECLSSEHFIPALSRCPAVEHLTLLPPDLHPRTPFDALPDGILPRLNSYRGPHHLAPCILRGRPAKHVDISVPSRPHRLASSLIKLDRTLESLSFRLDSVDLPSALLETIHGAFPSLAALTIADPALSSSAIRTALGAVPPQYALEELTLRIEGRDKFNLWIPPAESAADAAACFAKVRATLLASYPGLECVRFLHGGEGESLVWRRAPASGMFIQVSA